MLAALLLNPVKAGGNAGTVGGYSAGGKSVIEAGVAKRGFRDLGTEQYIYKDTVEEEDLMIMKTVKLFLEGQN